MNRSSYSAGRLSLALLVLLGAAWQYSNATGLVPEFPMENYCGVGVCPTEVPNRFLRFSKDREASPRSALISAESALVSNAASPYAWTDLAEVEWRADDLRKARYCFRQALQFGPYNSNIEARAAFFDRAQGDANR